MECRIQQHGNATEIEGKLPVKRLEIDSVSPLLTFIPYLYANISVLFSLVRDIYLIPL